MAESINIQPKVKGNKFTAEEFNEVLNKTNTAIQELNSNTQSLTGIASGITDIGERITVLESGNTVTEEIVWSTGQTKPTINADVIIGELQEGDTHYITKYKSGNNDVAIINNINKQFPSYYTTKNTTLTDQPYIVKSQGDKFVCLDNDYSKLFRLNADLTLDDTFSNEINDISSNEIYDFLVLNDNTILVTSYDTNNSISSMFKLDIDGNINQNFENTKIFNESLCLSSSSLVKTQSNGKIICCVYEDSYIPKRYIGRFNVDGSIDNTFNIILLSDSTVFTILNDDSIVYKFYDQPNNRYLLKKCNSEGIEDAAYAANFIDSDYSVEHIMDLNNSFTDGSILFIDTYNNNIIKINQDGTPNVEYSNNISTVNMYRDSEYANIILHNNKLVTISWLMSEISLSPKTDIVVIAENGIIESSVRLDGIGINIYESTNSYLITFLQLYKESYGYSQLYNSEFSPIFTTLVEKPHYALQKQLEYPIFTPNNYYIPAIINLQHEIALTAYVSGGEGSNYTYYNFNSETEEFDIRLTSQSSQFVYLNSFLFKITNDYYTSYEVFTYDLQEIPGLSIYGVDLNSAFIGGGYDSNARGITLSRMLVNGQNVIAIANNSGQTIEWFDEITGAVVSNWSWSGINGTTNNCCLFKISDTKVALAPIGNFSGLSLYICGVLDLETKEYVNYTTETFNKYVVVKKLDNSIYGIQYDVYYNNIKCIFPNQTVTTNSISYFVPVCILESMNEELIIYYYPNNSTIMLYDEKTGNMDYTNLLSLVNSGLFQIYNSHNFQNYDFYKLGDYYYLILNILGENGIALKSTDAITWEIIIGGNSDAAN